MQVEGRAANATASNHVFEASFWLTFSDFMLALLAVSQAGAADDKDGLTKVRLIYSSFVSANMPISWPRKVFVFIKVPWLFSSKKNHKKTTKTDHDFIKVNNEPDKTALQVRHSKRKDYEFNYVFVEPILFPKARGVFSLLLVVFIFSFCSCCCLCCCLPFQ